MRRMHYYSEREKCLQRKHKVSVVASVTQQSRWQHALRSWF